MRQELRGRNLLKSIVLDTDVHERLVVLSRRTGKPIRWHVERAICRWLALRVEPYEILDLSSLAHKLVEEGEIKAISISQAAERLRELASANGHLAPDKARCRRELRKAALSAWGRGHNWLDLRIVEQFNDHEDRVIESLRIEGASLSQIGQRVVRRPSTVYRRLTILAEKAEREFDET